MRLTRRDIDGFPILAKNIDYKTLLDRLATYEDAEEQERLVILPCKVGSTVYRIISRRLYCVGVKSIVEVEFNLDMLDEIGKTVFLNRIEAEAKLNGEE